MQIDTSQPQDEEQMLSIGQASEFLGISIDTLRRWEKKGRIVPHRSSGGHRYFNKNELTQLFGKRYSRAEKKPESKIDTQLQSTPTAGSPSHPPQHIWSSVDHHIAPPPHPAPHLPEISAPEKSNVDVENLSSKNAITPQVQSNSTLTISPEISVVENSQETSNLSPISPEIPTTEMAQETSIVPPNTPIEKETKKTVKKTKKQEEGLTSFQKFLIWAFFVFLIIDLILLFIWQSTRNLLSPIP